jgi:eukaryotic translation initiation factor 2C
MYIDYQQVKEKKPPSAAKPKRLLFFRDGVSEGQFGQVMEQEVAVLQSTSFIHR